MFEIILASFHRILLAFGLILPLGIQNVFIFNQGATQPTLLKAMPSVIAAALCDTVLILLAVLGVTLLLLKITWLKLFIFIAGFFFLIYMGYLTWNQKSEVTKDFKPLSFKKQIVFAASVSILNPSAIIDLITVIGTSSIQYEASPKWAFSISCILVSWIWFYFLAYAGHTVHKIDKDGAWVKRLNKVAAVIMWVLAIYLGLQAIKEL